MSDQNTNFTEEIFEQSDIDANKTMAGLAYLIFFLPLIACPDSRYAKFHANQALLLLLFAVIGSTISGIIPIIGWFILGPIVGLMTIVLFIIGLMNGLQGKAKRLPIIGKIDILK